MDHPSDSYARLVATNAALQKRINELEDFVAHRIPLIDPVQGQSRRTGILLDNLPGMVYRCRNDPHWTMEYVSTGVEKLTGYTAEEIRRNGMNYSEVILAEDRERVWEAVQSALDQDRHFELVYRIRTREGDLKWVWERGWGIWSESDELLMLEGFITDISALKTTEQALRESEQRYKHIVESSHEGIWMIDAGCHTTFVNSRMAAMLGYEVEDMLGRCLYDFMPEECRESIQRKLEKNASKVAEQHDIRFLRKDGAGIWALLSIKPMTDGNGDPGGLLAMAVDITDRKRMEATLHRLATSDPLTGLFNRRHFYHLAQQELERFRRYRYPLTAIMADLDHFKRTNDTFGHLAGDLVLQKAAELMREQLRTSDILCRYGGEEFAMLLPETDLKTAVITAERLRATIAAKPVETDQGSIAMTVSLGVAELPPGSMRTVETLLDYADRMLYIAKERGRNQVAVRDEATPSASSAAAPDGHDDEGRTAPKSGQ
ncbi:sensor domain-containing diguanylate cyclase [Imhoffiella purpurea]|uniref:GGDEF domain protein n=1 Tax=Imhoffiella purpurea TaxID=1249627 RepID=W9V2Y2_9GAMM|nr:GGDEF domain-containing protein [Imhoffiella purpurea]EXJ13823.1 GGDEF domain protein [Imhoffiella purpurea]